MMIYQRKLKQPLQVFYKKSVFKNFAIFTGKNLCWSLFLIKLQAFSPSDFTKKRIQHRCFPVNNAKFLRKTILKNLCERLLLRTEEHLCSRTLLNGCFWQRF